MIASRTLLRQSSEGPQQAFVLSLRSTGMCLTTKWRSPEAWAVVCPFDGDGYVTGAESFVDAVAGASTSRAFGEKVESLIVDSHDGANRIQDPHWNKGASHEWGSLIPTICANVSLRQSKPVIPARKLLSATTWL